MGVGICEAIDVSSLTVAAKAIDEALKAEVER